MVNNQKHRLLVSGACITSVRAKGRVRIDNGPVYDLKEAQCLLAIYGLVVINESARNDQSSFLPKFSDDELTDFILALTSGDFDVSERCKTSVGRTLDCDGYAMTWNRSRACRWSSGARFYVKFGFGDVDPRCLIVSIHNATH